MTFETLLDLCAKTAYPEPPSALHDAIIDQSVAFLEPKLPRNAKILDVGCGSSLRAADLFRDKGHEVWCNCILEQEIEVAKSKSHFVVRGDMHRILHPDGKWNQIPFHAIWMRHIAEHSPCPLLLLCNMRVMAAEDCWLYLEIPKPHTACLHEANPNHFSVLTETGWGNILTRAGWTIRSEWERTMLTDAGPDAYYSFICQNAKS